MKYITLIIGLLVVGCGKQEQTNTNESTPTTTAKPVKELTLEEKVVGTYEFKLGEKTLRYDLLETGIVEQYRNGKKGEGGKWKIVEGQIHVIDVRGTIDILRINKDGSITYISYIPKDGKRTAQKEEFQLTLKKIK